MENRDGPPRGGDFRSAPVRTPALLLVACSGCIALEKDDDPGIDDLPWSGAVQPTPERTAPAPSATQSRSTVVPVDPVPVQPGELLPNPNPANVTPVPLTRIETTRPVAETTTVFEDHYTLYHSARGLQVDVVDVPFIITFSATPKHPEPDANSRLVADEGYHGIYGSDREKSIRIYRAGAGPPSSAIDYYEIETI